MGARPALPEFSPRLRLCEPVLVHVPAAYLGPRRTDWTLADFKRRPLRLLLLLTES